MSAALWAFGAAALVCGLIVYGRDRLAWSLDLPGAGPQKFHAGAVPRIGGVGIAVGLGTAALWLGAEEMTLVLVLLVAAVPVFVAGLIEDLTKKVSASNRLLCAFAAAALGFVLIDARVTDLDLPVGNLFELSILSFAFTVFAVGGFSHALNIVDGFNGLAGMVAVLLLAVLAIVAAQVGDTQVMTVALVVGGAVLGFLVWNYPRGAVFAGDSGAYLVGFLIAELAVVLPHRNAEVSPWFPLLLLAYPVVETCFSMYRRQVIYGESCGTADGLHLHSLVYRRLVRGAGRPRGWKENALTTPYLVVLAALAAGPAMLLWNDTLALQIAMAAFVALYVWLYWSIVRFGTPRWLVLRRWRKALAAPDAEVPATSGGKT